MGIKSVCAQCKSFFWMFVIHNWLNPWCGTHVYRGLTAFEVIIWCAPGHCWDAEWHLSFIRWVLIVHRRGETTLSPTYRAQPQAVLCGENRMWRNRAFLLVEGHSGGVTSGPPAGAWGNRTPARGLLSWGGGTYLTQGIWVVMGVNGLGWPKDPVCMAWGVRMEAAWGGLQSLNSAWL
jgi:hypothetical protein